MSGFEEYYNDQQVIRRTIVALASLDDEEEELMKLLTAFAGEDPLPPQLYKKRRRSPCVWAFNRYGSFWERDVPGNSDAFFKEHFRMEREHFDTLVEGLQGLKKKDTNFRTAIPLDKRIAIALYTLGTSAEYKAVGRLFGVSRPMVGKILHEFCVEFYKVFAPKYLPRNFLTQEKLEECVKGFEALGFPQCFGAMDGTHIEINPRWVNGAVDYFNDEDWYSTIIFGLVDYRCRFLYVNAGCPGRSQDSVLYESCTLNEMVDSTDLFQANSKCLGGTDVPVIILADSAFTLSTTLMTPYIFDGDANEDEKTFNDAHFKARRVVGNAFLQLKSRFRRIAKGLDFRCGKATNIVLTCCVLHNFLNENNSTILESWKNLEDERPQPEQTNYSDDYDTHPEAIRKALTNYIKTKL